MSGNIKKTNKIEDEPSNPILIKFQYVEDKSVFNELANIKVSDMDGNPICGIQNVKFHHDAKNQPILILEIIPEYVKIVAEDLQYELEKNSDRYMESVKNGDGKPIEYIKKIEFFITVEKGWENLELRLTR